LQLPAICKEALAQIGKEAGQRLSHPGPPNGRDDDAQAYWRHPAAVLAATRTTSFGGASGLPIHPSKERIP
jgi:hypothetical protein